MVPDMDRSKNLLKGREQIKKSERECKIKKITGLHEIGQSIPRVLIFEEELQIRIVL